MSNSPDALKTPTVFGPMAKEDAQLLAGAEHRSPVAKLVLREIGATAAEEHFALVTEDRGTNHEYGARYVSLNPNDLGAEVMADEAGEFTRHGLPPLKEAYEAVTRERDEQFASPPIPAHQEVPGSTSLRPGYFKGASAEIVSRAARMGFNLKAHDAKYNPYTAAPPVDSTSSPK